MHKGIRRISWVSLFLVSFACGNGGVTDESDDAAREFREVIEDETSEFQIDTVFDDVFPGDSLLDMEEDIVAGEDNVPADEITDFIDIDISSDTEEIDRDDAGEEVDISDGIDVTCECDPDSVLACITSCGTSGLQRCSSSCVWGPCRADEICNNCDDDADTHIDDGIARFCDCPIPCAGPCRQACVMGSWTDCVCID